MDSAKAMAEILLNVQAVKIKMDPPFTWTSGIKSPVYCDNRILISYVLERQLIVDSFKQTIIEKGIMPEVIGGTATAAIPWAAFLAYEMKLPMIYIRPEKKAHGAGKQIEGIVEPGQKVLIIEDLISTGGSSIASAQVVKKEGKAQVTDVLAIMSWEMKGVEDKFKEEKLNLTTLTNFTHLTSLAKEKGQITEEQYEVILKFKEDPKKWGEKVVGS